MKTLADKTRGERLLEVLEKIFPNASSDNYIHVEAAKLPGANITARGIKKCIDTNGSISNDLLAAIVSVGGDINYILTGNPGPGNLSEDQRSTLMMLDKAICETEEDLARLKKARERVLLSQGDAKELAITFTSRALQSSPEESFGNPSSARKKSPRKAGRK